MEILDVKREIGYNKVSSYMYFSGEEPWQYEENKIEENMRKIKRLIYQIARFSAVGVTCFAVDYGLLIILTEFTSLEYFN